MYVVAAALSFLKPFFLIRKVKVLRRNTSIVSSRLFLASPRRFPVSRPPRQFCYKMAVVVASSESKFGESILVPVIFSNAQSLPLIIAEVPFDLDFGENHPPS